MIFNQFDAFAGAESAWQIVSLAVSLAVTIHLLRTTRRRSKVSGTCESSHGQQKQWKEHPWQKAGYGKHKYSGLRERPFTDDDHIPPKYRFGNDCDPRIKEPDLTPAEAKGIAELRESLSDIAKEGCRIDTATLQRILRARKGNVKRAERLARKGHALRMDHNVSAIEDDDDLLSYYELLKPWYHAGGYLPMTKDGQYVILEKIGKTPAALFNAIPFDVLFRLDLLHITRGCAAVEEDCARRGTAFQNAILIEDAKGLNSDILSLSYLKKYRKLVQMRDTIEPELVKIVLIVRAPKALAATWNFVSKIALTPETAAKVQMASSDASSLALLRKHLHDDDIPAYLGGNLMVDGDPECRTIIAPGGDIPDEIIERLVEMIEANSNKNKETDSTSDLDETEIPTNEGYFCGCWGGRK